MLFALAARILNERRERVLSPLQHVLEILESIDTIVSIGVVGSNYPFCASNVSGALIGHPKSIRWIVRIYPKYYAVSVWGNAVGVESPAVDKC